MPMRILFLTHAPETPSTRYRVLPYLPHLERDGAMVERTDIPDGLLARWRLFRRAAAFDLVFLQKRLLPPWQLRMLRRHAKALIYDFDDPMPYSREGDSVVLSTTRVARFRAVLGASDAVIVNHAGMADLARGHGARIVHVIPTPVDLATWQARESWASDRPVFGWIGTRSNLPVLRTIAEALKGRRLRVVADASIDLPGVEVEFVPWEAGREADQVRSFDIGLAPLPDDDWSRWKMPYKILSCFAAGVPVIASRLGAVGSVIRDGENGLLAGDWPEAIARLERDASMRERLGRAGRRTVEEGYSLSVCYERLKRILRV
jgi:glycosyltransferase involved in cell wall biosynthesis